MDIDKMCEEQLQALNARIDIADSISSDIKDLVKDTYSIKESLDSAQRYSDLKEYLNAYKSLLNSMSTLINLNKEILEKYTALSTVLKDQHAS